MKFTVTKSNKSGEVPQEKIKDKNLLGSSMEYLVPVIVYRVERDPALGR